MRRTALLFGGFIFFLNACGTPGPKQFPSLSAQSGPDAHPSPLAQPADSRTPAGPENIVAYIDGRPLTAADLWPPLAELAGAQVLTEQVVGHLVERRLEVAGLAIGPGEAEQEEHRLLSVLHEDPDQAQRLLSELRTRRGWGRARYAQLLRRSAGLRLLIQNEVHVSDAAIDRAYRVRYGKKYTARLIVVDTLPQASDLAARARAGEPFIDLATAHSTDPSASRGGLLEPISPEDATYPAALRTMLAKLTPGRVSDPIALENGYALALVEKVIEPDPTDAADPAHRRQQVAQRLTLQLERVLMDRRARAILQEADVVVLDPALQAGWRQGTRERAGGL